MAWIDQKQARPRCSWLWVVMVALVLLTAGCAGSTSSPPAMATIPDVPVGADAPSTTVPAATVPATAAPTTVTTVTTVVPPTRPAPTVAAPPPRPAPPLPPPTIAPAVLRAGLNACLGLASSNRDSASLLLAQQYNQAMAVLSGRGTANSSGGAALTATYNQDLAQVQAQYASDVAVCHARWG